SYVPPASNNRVHEIEVKPAPKGKLEVSFRVRLVKNSPPVTLAQYSKILSPLTRFPDIRVLRVNITTPDLSASDAASSRVMWLKLSSPSLITINTRRVGLFQSRAPTRSLQAMATES